MECLEQNLLHLLDLYSNTLYIINIYTSLINVYFLAFPPELFLKISHCLYEIKSNNN